MHEMALVTSIFVSGVIVWQSCRTAECARAIRGTFPHPFDENHMKTLLLITALFFAAASAHADSILLSPENAVIQGNIRSKTFSIDYAAQAGSRAVAAEGSLNFDDTLLTVQSITNFGTSVCVASGNRIRIYASSSDFFSPITGTQAICKVQLRAKPLVSGTTTLSIYPMESFDVGGNVLQNFLVPISYLLIKPQPIRL
jgi:hypothetical protein